MTGETGDAAWLNGLFYLKLKADGKQTIATYNKRKENMLEKLLSEVSVEEKKPDNVQKMIRYGKSCRFTIS